MFAEASPHTKTHDEGSKEKLPQPFVRLSRALFGASFGTLVVFWCSRYAKLRRRRRRKDGRKQMNIRELNEAQII
jgi:hypothetical protein